MTGIEDVLRLTARYVSEVLCYDDCVIYLRDADGVLEQRVAWGPKLQGEQVVDPLRLAMGEGIVGTAALSQQPQLVVDAANDSRYIADLTAPGSELAVPIVYAGETLGVIDSESSHLGFYDEDDADLVGAVAAVLACMVRSALSADELNQTIEELHHTQLELELVAETDLLTGIGNRRRLESAFTDATARASRYGVAVVDIDGLKRVNDHYGNAMGDAVLRAVSDTLARHCSTEGLTLGRCESDEFVIIASPLPKGFAVRIAAALQDIRALSVPGFDPGYVVTASAGVAYGADLEAWHNADDAMALAKHAGGDTLWIYRPDDPGIVQLRTDRAWVQRIEHAVVDDSLRLAAQAVKATADGEVLFHEVLLRWRETSGEWTAPTDLLAAAERLGLEQVIDSWVTRNVVGALRRADVDVCLAMNWTVGSITSASMVRMVIDELDAAGVDPGRLVIEVTEHACIESPEQFDTAVSRLRGAGIRVALDDLGSGWSSLRTLQATPVDYIKLDGQWVCGARRDELALIAIRSMIECATALETKVIAEWVEDDATLELVEGLGADYVQGWLVHRPEPLSALIEAPSDAAAADVEAVERPEEQDRAAPGLAGSALLWGKPATSASAASRP
ncbi:MAG: EAL domain-containing protein [Actinomycetota bacterium]